MNATRGARPARVLAAALAGLLAAAPVASPLAASTTVRRAAPSAPRVAAPSSPPNTVAPAVPDTARPSFAGRWKLDMARSTFGSVPGQPKARTDVIEQRDGEIRQVLYLVLATGPDTTVYRYRLDGTPTVNRVGSQDITARVRWEPGALHLLSKTKLMLLDMSLDERWRLAAGGDTLVMSRTVKYPMGEAQQSLRFGRE